MSVRKRKWTTRSGETKEAWIVDYSQDGERHIETFKRKKDADAYAPAPSFGLGSTRCWAAVDRIGLFLLGHIGCRALLR
jgi:hypothetical protein